MTSSAPKHALSIDVEDYFQVSAFAGCIDRKSWDTMPCRVERNVAAILSMLAEENAKATFFVLGWVAERYPMVVREIVESGHELASHGYGHQRIQELDRQQFREDITRAKGLLEDVSGVVIKGYRAPSFSVGEDTLWALDVIQQCGYQYSSSIYPVKRDLYGMPDSPRFSYYHSNGLAEIPMTTLRIGERNIPAGGGGFFRLFPYAITRGLIRAVESRDNRPCMIYLHPWEFDPGQPTIDNAPLKSKFRHRINLSRTAPRFRRLLRDFSWDRMDRVFFSNDGVLA